MKKLIKQIYLKLKYRNIKLGADCNITLSTQFGGNNSIGYNTTFDGNIGYSSYIGHDSEMNAYIGKFCSIGSFVFVVGGTHPISTFVSTSPVFYSKNKTLPSMFANRNSFEEHKFVEYNGRSYSAIIGNDVWVGSHSLILEGVTIGDGAVIGCGSIVTKDIPPYAIVAGCPAKVIRYRFDDERIRFLELFRWWDKSEGWIKENAELFGNINDFYREQKEEQK